MSDGIHDLIVQLRADGHELIVTEAGELVISTSYEQPVDPQLRAMVRAHQRAALDYLTAEQAAGEALHAFLSDPDDDDDHAA